MTSPADRLIWINVSLDANTQTALLEGLESWLRLGLLSDSQVKQLGQEQLSCPWQPLAVPLAEALEPPQRLSTARAYLLWCLCFLGLCGVQRLYVGKVTSGLIWLITLGLLGVGQLLDLFWIPQMVRAANRRQDRLGPSPVPELIAPQPSAPRRADRVGLMLQSLMAEFSVIWLLFLGVFMVVVSSGVLAASQWRQFSPLGQYAILLGYTLAFGGASVWAGRQGNLNLTAHMLRLATLLMIPVNFWMIDGVRLWNSGLGWMLAASSALLLSAMTVFLLRPTATDQPANARLTLLNSIGLSWLHWGWGWMGFPLLATYLGTVGTALSLFVQYRNHSPASSPTSPNRLPLGVLTVAYAALLLVARAVLVAQVPVAQLGLALGLCGWLLGWLARGERSREQWTLAGTILLLVGWGVCVEAPTPWQALAVSGLGLWLLAERLRHRHQTWALTATFLVGLQSLWLLWRLLPAPVQQTCLEFGVRVAGNLAMPWALLGVAVFPYVVLTLWWAGRLRHWQQPLLADQAEILALILGAVLSLLSLGNPTLRTLNLLLSSLTLAEVVRKRANTSAILVYLTHLTALAALASGIDRLAPDLDRTTWAGILLTGMVAEWGFCVGSRWRLWRRSAWHIGLGLAAVSYLVLLGDYLSEGHDSRWNLLWLATPLSLTWLGGRRQFPQPPLATGLSVAALVFLQPLTLETVTSRLVSLGVATALMLFNTQQIQQTGLALLTVGFGLSWGGAALWQVLPETVGGAVYTELAALAALSLWLLWRWLVGRETALARIYAQATDGWATVLSSVNLLALTLYALSFYTVDDDAAWGYALAAALTTLALGCRQWQQPGDLGAYGIAWGLELTVAILVALRGGSVEHLALANLGLGLLAQVAGDWQARRSAQTYRYYQQVIPLVYAVLGLGLAHASFTAATGWYTLAAALVGLGVGRRQASLKPLSYLALLGVSAAAYELLIYQLLQAKGGSSGDGFAALAALGLVIAVVERWLSRWLAPYLRLRVAELKPIAHLHWAGSSGLVGLALLNALSPFGEQLSLGVLAVLAFYSLLQGRGSMASREAEGWTYAGISEATVAIGYALYLSVTDTTGLIAWAAALACVLAYALYVLPWQAWGWSLRPWRRAAGILPGAAVFLTAGGIALQSLLLTGAFYAWFAWASRQVRLSYLSVGLADWAILRFLQTRAWENPLWSALLVGGSLLYVAQIDPHLQGSNQRATRHLLRSLAAALMCLSALYQSQGDFGLGLLTIALSIGLILAGLAQRIRAFLYVGTVTFVFKVLQQLWVFISDYSLLLWAMGIVLGLMFIWIAASFEARRSQMTALVRNWVSDLDEWQ